MHSLTMQFRIRHCSGVHHMMGEQLKRMLIKGIGRLMQMARWTLLLQRLSPTLW
ncbi:Uncharacterised protein [Klebsiella pneumoniae]|nr:Uncharacterised protein [Klebsiella pneumoniae]